LGLKTFHLFFIVCADILAVGFGAWCIRDYTDSHNNLYLILGVASLIASFGLSVYLGWFLKKLKKIGYLVLPLLMLLPARAMACPVCVGNPTSPMAISANQGVFFLLSVITTVLVAFGGLFIYWMVRAARLERASLA
jgi:hypothetical protein